MPTIVVKGAIIVVSVAVAAAIAVYESPQARQFAEEIRRKIALALHALGDEINPNQQPLFNRPEDAEGFLQSQGAITSGEPGVEADAESARRQREELMYWNAIRLEKLERQKALEEKERPSQGGRGSSFEDFLQEDKSGEMGSTFVYNTGADSRHDGEEGLRNRGVRGLQRGSAWANPFSDEHNIESDTSDARLLSPDESEKYEVRSEGLYSANEDPLPSHTRETTATIAELIDASPAAIPDPPIMLPEINEAQWAQEHPLLANQAGIPIPRDESAESAFASIHAWADNANQSFYSPLPTTPRAGSPTRARSSSPPRPLNITLPRAESESEYMSFEDPDVSVPGSGDATPTDSMSLAGSGDAEEVWGPRSGATSESGRDHGVESVRSDEDSEGEGVITPGSWSEVGSVVSEGDMVVH